MPEVVVTSTGCDDKVVVANGRTTGKDNLLFPSVNSNDIRHDDLSVLLIFENRPDRCRNLGRRQTTRGNLIKEWLKEVVVGPVDESDLNRYFLERAGCGKATKAATDDDDFWSGCRDVHLMAPAT